MSRILIILLFLSSSTYVFAKKSEDCGDDPSCKEIGLTKAPTDLPSIPKDMVTSFSPFASGGDDAEDEKKKRASQKDDTETPHTLRKSRLQDGQEPSTSDESAG